MLKLVYNKGFSWNEEKGVHYKGYISVGEEMLDKDGIFALLQGIDTYGDFIDTIRKFMGCFAVVIEKQRETWIAVDIARSFPMFISFDGRIVSDSAEEARKEMGISFDEVDDTYFAEMLLSMNTSHGHTVYREIVQCDLGQTAQIKNGMVSFDYYYRHANFHKQSRSKEELFNELSRIADRMFERLIRSLEKKTVVVPLSGGYDSRFVVSMLKKKGYQDVICYTYGNREDYDVRYSKKVAEALNYKWYYVEYTKERWDDFFDVRNNGVTAYFEETHNHSTLPHIQDYIALSTLIEEGKIPSDAIIVPGFCGDLPAGSFVRKESEIPSFDQLDISKWIYGQHFMNTTVSSAIKDEIIKNIRSYIADLAEKISSFDDFTTVYEAWFTGNRPAMYVVNSNRVSEHFGHQWRLPLWDKEYLDFWYGIPVEYRYNKSLYIEWLFTNLYERYGIAFIKPVPNPIVHENTSPVIKSLIGKTKKALIYFGMNLGKTLYNRNNTNNFNYAAIQLFKKIKDKKSFHYNYVSVMQVEQLWWCEKMYGIENIRRITNNSNDTKNKV